MMNSLPSIQIRDLLVRRGGRLVLPGVALGVRAGVVTGLLGPSGSGKSTLMRAIAGVQIVESGDVIVLGEPAGSPRNRRRVGYVTQAPSVYGDLTVRENLHYFARILDVPVGRVGEAIDIVDLGEHERQVVRTLSGGERSRVSLATALLGRPDVLVLDEPTVGLDPVLRRDLWNTFHRLAEQGATLLVSSHVMDEAERSDELILMREGRIVATGAPDELRRADRPDRPRRSIPRPRGGSMSIRITLATAARVLRQIRRDHRTLALILVVPAVLLTLFKYVFYGQEETFDRVGPPMVGLFPFISMFLVTSIAMLRERTTGTLERLMSLPLAKLDLLLGYGIAFALLAVVQATLTSAVAFGALGLDSAGPVWLVVLLAVANAVLGMALGLFLSAFAQDRVPGRAVHARVRASADPAFGPAR